MYRKNVVIISVFLISFILFFYSKNQNRDKIKIYLGSYDFCIGKVNSYISRGSIGYNIGRSSITYKYTINNIEYTKNYDSFFYKLPFNPNINIEFIVVYNKTLPENSLILGDFPVINEGDFAKYLKLFNDEGVDF